MVAGSQEVAKAPESEPTAETTTTAAAATAAAAAAAGSKTMATGPETAAMTPGRIATYNTNTKPCAPIPVASASSSSSSSVFATAPESTAAAQTETRTETASMETLVALTGSLVNIPDAATSQDVAAAATTPAELSAPIPGVPSSPISSTFPPESTVASDALDQTAAFTDLPALIPVAPSSATSPASSPAFAGAAATSEKFSVSAATPSAPTLPPSLPATSSGSPASSPATLTSASMHTRSSGSSIIPAGAATVAIEAQELLQIAQHAMARVRDARRLRTIVLAPSDVTTTKAAQTNSSTSNPSPPLPPAQLFWIERTISIVDKRATELAAAVERARADMQARPDGGVSKRVWMRWTVKDGERAKETASRVEKCLEVLEEALKLLRDKETELVNKAQGGVQERRKGRRAVIDTRRTLSQTRSSDTTIESTVKAAELVTSNSFFQSASNSELLHRENVFPSSISSPFPTTAGYSGSLDPGASSGHDLCGIPDPNETASNRSLSPFQTPQKTSSSSLSLSMSPSHGTPKCASPYRAHQHQVILATAEDEVGARDKMGAMLAWRRERNPWLGRERACELQSDV